MKNNNKRNDEELSLYTRAFIAGVSNRWSSYVEFNCGSLFVVCGKIKGIRKWSREVKLFKLKVRVTNINIFAHSILMILWEHDNI